MLVWRICARRHASRSFTGEGARLYGGRWNPRGTPMVYTAGTFSLAVLEMLVHLDPDTFPDHLVAVAAEVPDEFLIEEISSTSLPRGWRRYPANEELARRGLAWIRAAKSAVLSVPSAVVPRERNYLINPRHPDFAGIRIQRPEPFYFDPRLSRRR